MNSLTQITVPFHTHELLIVEYNNQPYTPMRPIVEGIGLDWMAQLVKIKQRFSSVVGEITTTGKDGKQYKMICLPLKKLFGWLMTISPNKVKPELRDKVIMYQNECDDVLWEYWTKGQAINECKSPKLISKRNLATLQIMVDEIAGGNPTIEKEVWGRLNLYFEIPHQSELPAIYYVDAAKCLKKMEHYQSTRYQLPMLPVPFQKGKFLVVVDEDGAVKIHDAKGKELVDMESVQKLTDEVLTMFVEASEFNERLKYFKEHFTLDDSRTPHIGLLQNGKTAATMWDKSS